MRAPFLPVVNESSTRHDAGQPTIEVRVDPRRIRAPTMNKSYPVVLCGRHHSDHSDRCEAHIRPQQAKLQVISATSRCPPAAFFAFE
jgi:muramidase (phage lysozyme)